MLLHTFLCAMFLISQVIASPAVQLGPHGLAGGVIGNKGNSISSETIKDMIFAAAASATTTPTMILESMITATPTSVNTTLLTSSTTSSVSASITGGGVVGFDFSGAKNWR